MLLYLHSVSHIRILTYLSLIPRSKGAIYKNLVLKQSKAKNHFHIKGVYVLCQKDIYWSEHANSLAPGRKTTFSHWSKAPVLTVWTPTLPLVCLSALPTEIRLLPCFELKPDIRLTVLRRYVREKNKLSEYFPKRTWRLSWPYWTRPMLRHCPKTITNHVSHFHLKLTSAAINFINCCSKPISRDLNKRYQLWERCVQQSQLMPYRKAVKTTLL